MWRLQERARPRSRGCRTSRCSPSAGSHGELAGVLLTRAYHEDHGEHRTKVLTPDTAHGTNPATVTMAGYEVVKVGTDAHGNVDLDDLRAKADEQVACLMLTNPSTLGLFETGIEEIERIVHGVGATLYYDGANLNAIMGIAVPATWASTSCTSTCTSRSPSPTAAAAPAPGRSRCRTGSSRTCRGRRWSVASRRTTTAPSRSTTSTTTDPSRSGACAASRATTACSCAPTPTSARSERRGCARRPRSPCSTPTTCWRGCSREGVIEYLPAAYERLCMHEFVLSGEPMKRELESRTLDLAKRLLDHGVHPPTVYFPLIVEEALLVEPTETETKETLDRFAEVVAEILREAREDPEIARSAPYTTPVRRLDEAAAARHPVVRQAM